MSLVFSFFFGLGLLVLGGYILFGLGSVGLSELQKESKGASLGLATALAHLSGERITEQGAVALSATMAETVRQTKDRFDKNLSRYKIEEIFLLDSLGKPRAHSNVAKMAKDSQIDYNRGEYLEILDRSKGYPNVSYKYYPLERLRLFPEELYNGVSSLSKDLGGYLRQHYPERIISKYRLAVAVYPVDQKTPALALHLVVLSEASNYYLARLSEYSIWSLYIGCFLVFVFSFLMFFLIFWVWYSPSKRLAWFQKKESSHSSNGPTASELELMADAQRQTSSHSSNGPTASELELMADAQKQTSSHSSDAPMPGGFAAIPSCREPMEEAIYDAIPLDTEELSLGEARPSKFFIYEDL